MPQCVPVQWRPIQFARTPRAQIDGNVRLSTLPEHPEKIVGFHQFGLGEFVYLGFNFAPQDSPGAFFAPLEHLGWKHLFGSVLKLSDIGWRSLTIRWSFFFVVLALLNEAVWRTQTTELWIQFKLFGVLPLTILFSAAQLPLINRHKID